MLKVEIKYFFIFAPTMPKAIADIKGYKFSFYSKEGNEPPHIHVFKGDGEAKIWLNEDGIRLEKWHDLKEQELKKALKLVEQNRFELIKSWNEYFNRYRNRKND